MKALVKGNMNDNKLSPSDGVHYLHVHDDTLVGLRPTEVWQAVDKDDSIEQLVLSGQLSIKKIADDLRTIYRSVMKEELDSATTAMFDQKIAELFAELRALMDDKDELNALEKRIEALEARPQPHYPWIQPFQPYIGDNPTGPGWPTPQPVYVPHDPYPGYPLPQVICGTGTGKTDTNIRAMNG